MADEKETRTSVVAEEKETRRNFVKKIAYAAPLVLSLKAAPSFARNGSDDSGGK